MAFPRSTRNRWCDALKTVFAGLGGIIAIVAFCSYVACSGWIAGVFIVASFLAFSWGAEDPWRGDTVQPALTRFGWVNTIVTFTADGSTEVLAFAICTIDAFWGDAG